MDWTGGKGVDLVLDPIGGEHLMQSYRCLGSGAGFAHLVYQTWRLANVKVNGLVLNHG